MYTQSHISRENDKDDKECTSPYTISLLMGAGKTSENSPLVIHSNPKLHFMQYDSMDDFGIIMDRIEPEDDLFEGLQVNIPTYEDTRLNKVTEEEVIPLPFWENADHRARLEQLMSYQVSTHCNEML